MSWFLIFYKYHRVFVGHTSKIPVKLVNIFFTQPTLHPSSNNGISQTNKDQIFEFECSTQSSPAPCTSIDTLVALSNNNLNIYTNESWVCDHRIDQFVVHYITLKVGVRLSSNWSWPLLDDGWWGASSEYFFLLCFGGKGVLLYAIFIILATYIWLYTSNTTSLRYLCSKENQIVGTGWSSVSIFCPSELNCGDWSPLNLGTLERFLTKTTVTFVGLISPNFWVGQTHQFLYHFL